MSISSTDEDWAAVRAAHGPQAFALSKDPKDHATVEDFDGGNIARLTAT